MKFPHYSMSTIIEDTHNTASFGQRYRCWRSAASRRGLAGEPSETLIMKFPHYSMSTIIEDTHNSPLFYVNQLWSFHLCPRHSQHCILRSTVSALKERSILARPCGWTKWDTNYEVSPLFYVNHHRRHSQHCILRSTVSVIHGIGAEHLWQSTIIERSIWRGLAGEPSETLRMKFPRCSVSAIITDTHNTGSFGQRHPWRRSAASKGSCASESSKLLCAWGSLDILSHWWPQTLTIIGI